MLGTIGDGKLDVPGLEPLGGNGFVTVWLAAPLGGMPAKNFSMSSLERLPILEAAVGKDLEWEMFDIEAADVDG